MKITINENTIRTIVLEAVKSMINENFKSRKLADAFNKYGGFYNKGGMSRLYVPFSELTDNDVVAIVDNQNRTPKDRFFSANGQSDRRYAQALGFNMGEGDNLYSIPFGDGRHFAVVIYRENEQGMPMQSAKQNKRERMQSNDGANKYQSVKGASDIFNTQKTAAPSAQGNSMASNYLNYRRGLDENAIREMVVNALRNALNENLEGEYRTKGSLNKKTLEKQLSNVDKTSGAASLENREDYNPDWDDYSMDNIKGLYGDDEQEFDDTQAGGEFKADPSDPYFIDENGKRIDVDAIGQFHNDFAIIKKDGRVNFVNSEGHPVSNEWFDACNDFEDGFAVVSKDGKRNFLSGDGRLLLNTWVDRAGDFMAGRAPIIIQGQRREVDRNGKIY